MSSSEDEKGPKTKTKVESNPETKLKWDQQAKDSIAQKRVIKKQRKLKLSYTKEEFDKLPSHVQGKLHSSAPQIYHWYERKDKNRLVECKYCKKSYQFRNKQ